MRQPLVLGSALLATLAFTSSAGAVTLYVSPTATATCGCTSRDMPCTLGAAASMVMPGDVVKLMDGVYHESLYLTDVSGTESAWITFEADECATPILEGPGSPPDDPDDQSGGVGSSTAEYVRFRGIVVRGWNIGFGNGWADGVDSDRVSNGHWDIENCISYANGRTGFTFFSAPEFHLKNSIAAHNGSSTVHSWSSGVTLYEATGTVTVEGTVSFENTDRQKRTDGSGFIVDEQSNNVLLVNNIAFGNAGSCFRMTDSSGTKFINNTCFHNSQFGSLATGPSNPSEIYFTNGGITQQNVMFLNNAIVGTGMAPAGSQPIVNKPSSGWMNNVEMTGNVTFFTDPTGTNPNFVPKEGETTLTGKGATGNGAPTVDGGFDPKCIVKRTPQLVGQIAAETWWQYDVDIDYIKSIGGVASCFNAGNRATPPEIGAYKAGAVTTQPVNMCTPQTTGSGGAATNCGGAGAGGDAGTGATGAGATGAGGSSGGTAPVAGSTSAGGSVSTGGTAPTAGTAPAAGSTGVAGSAPATGGSAGQPAGGAPSSGGAVPTAGSVATAGTTDPGGSGDAPEAAADDSGCGCRVAPHSEPLESFTAFGLLGLSALALQRRRRARS